MTAKKILVLDFDGVVHSYVSPWVDSHVIADAPVPGALDFIRRALDVFDVQIYSSRSASSTGRTAMQGWLLDHAMQLDKDDYSWVFNVKWPDTKPPAHITLDDRVWCFTGSWPPLDELLKFKPWNKLGDRASITVIPNVDAPRYMNLLRDYFKSLNTILQVWERVTHANNSTPLPAAITDALAKYPIEVRKIGERHYIVYLPDVAEAQKAASGPAYAATLEAPSDFKLPNAVIPVPTVAQVGEQKDLPPSQ